LPGDVRIPLVMVAATYEDRQIVGVGDVNQA
jgi:hypothetical protein